MPTYTTHTLIERLRVAGSIAWSLVGVAVLVGLGALLLMVLWPLLVWLVVALFVAITFGPFVDALARVAFPGPPGPRWPCSS